MSTRPPATPADSLLVSLLTAPGRGALAVVGVAGRDAARAIDAAFTARGSRPVAARADGTIAVGGWRATGEDVVVVRRRSDLVEVHCHGGVAAAAAVVAAIVAGGATAVAWPAWLAATGASATVVEAHEALALANGPRAARILARQAAGALDTELARLAAVRAAGDRRGAEAGFARLGRASRVGLRLTRPWRVVVAGPVNAGKSSLVNALAGHARSIVTPEPGTTRDLVEARIVLGGWEVDVIDTAGAREPGAAADDVERAGMARAAAAAAAADLVVRVGPAHERPAAAARGDLLVAAQIDRHSLAAGWPETAVPTSATTGAGIAELCAAIVDRLVPEERAEPGLLAGPVPFTPRQVAEIERLAPG